MNNENKRTLDSIFGMIISNFYWDEGIKPNRIERYSDEDLLRILKDFRKSRHFTKGGWRISNAGEYLKIAASLIKQADDGIFNKTVAWNSVIVLSFVALEEIVNMYIQISHVGMKEGNEFHYREVDLNKILNENLTWKLETYVYELSQHSFKEENPEWWKIFQDSKAIRNDVIHYHADVDKFIKRDSDWLSQINREVTAKRFIEIVPQIEKWLEDNYPEEVFEVDVQMKQLWEILKVRLKIDVNQFGKPEG